MKDPHIKEAIDESLSSVHFDAQDMHSVLRAVREQEAPARRAKARRAAPMRLERLAAVACAALVLVPLALFAFSGARTALPDIQTVAASQPDHLPGAHEDVVLASPLPAQDAISESRAIEIARSCFEARCDTSVFTFEEYAVDTAREGDAYLVKMTNIYGNGCAFTVTVSAADGSVLSFSDPAGATTPDASALDSAAVRDWLGRYGEDRSAWPEEIQAEFARRYEGRTAP